KSRELFDRLPRENAKNTKKKSSVSAIFAFFCGYCFWLKLCRAAKCLIDGGASVPASPCIIPDKAVSHEKAQKAIASVPAAPAWAGMGVSRHCPRRTANRPGSQRMARYKITDCLQSASAGQHAADGDRPRSGGSIELHPARVAVNISLTSIARHDSISTNHPERNQPSKP